MNDNQEIFVSHDVASLLCSRLCHELIGPLGALMGGFDMLQEFGDDFTQEEHAVLHQSAARLSMRTKFYRLAYGTAGHRLIAPQEIMPNLYDMLAEHHITFMPPDDAVFNTAPQGSLWLVMNLVILGVDILKANGAVKVNFPNGSLDDLQMECTGKEANIDDEFLQALQNELPDEKLTAYNVHVLHNALIAKRLGYKIMCNQQTGNVTMNLTRL